jgi:hypothetical protein
MAMIVGLCVAYGLTWGTHARRLEFGPSLPERLRLSFEYSTERPYETYAFGNSRIYRGFNPDKLSHPTFNFAFDNDSFNNIYYKLLYLERVGRIPKRVIIGVDYFQFSHFPPTQDLYAPFLDADFMSDYQEQGFEVFGVKVQDFFTPPWNAQFNKWMTLHFSQTALASAKVAVNRLRNKPHVVRYILKSNGQFQADIAMAAENDLITRNPERLSGQEAYFEKILEWCRKHQVETVILLPPLRSAELQNYSPELIQDYTTYFSATAKTNNARFVDLSRSAEFKMSDFADATHLTPAGADKFSTLLDRVLRF